MLQIHSDLQELLASLTDSQQLAAMPTDAQSVLYRRRNKETRIQRQPIRPTLWVPSFIGITSIETLINVLENSTLSHSMLV